jgi:uncharacterized membrane protein
MGGFYGKLLITAYIMFCAILLGFILMCTIFGRRNGFSCEKNHAETVKPETHGGSLNG